MQTQRHLNAVQFLVTTSAADREGTSQQQRYQIDNEDGQLCAKYERYLAVNTPRNVRSKIVRQTQCINLVRENYCRYATVNAFLTSQMMQAPVENNAVSKRRPQWAQTARPRYGAGGLWRGSSADCIR